VTRRWFKRDYLTKTEHFFVKHGGRAIIIARFVPIVRTFAPFTAGFGRMHYSRFLAFSVGGGLLWVAGISMLGYALGNIPVIKSNFKLVSVMIIVVSVLPIVIEVIKHKLEAKKKAER
jgi:membrane-associated protein